LLSVTRSTTVRYCVIAASTAAALLALVVGINLVVDPFGTYRLVELEGVNLQKPAVHHRVRLVKANEVRQVRPRGIVLGTSRSHLGLRPSHEGWDPEARPVYNLAFDGATTKEMYHYLVHAHTVRPLRQVVLGLDTYHATLAPATTRPDFDPYLLDSPGFGVPALIRSDLRILSSLDTARASLATLGAQNDRQPQWFAADGQRLGDVFFRRPGEPFEQLGPRGYFEEIDRLEVGFKRAGRLAASAGGTARPATSETSLDYIKRIVAFCRAERIDLRVIVVPEHVHQLEITAALGEWRAIEEAKRAIVSLLTEDAAQHPDAPPIPLWDFTGYSSVTTEALPPSGSRAEMRFYWDSSHFKSIVGDFVLDRVFGLNDGRTAPPDFGVRLTASTIESALAQVRAEQLAYRRANPEEAAWIRTLVEGDTPGRRDTNTVAVGGHR